MTLVLELPPELEQRLREAAARRGVTSADLALFVLEKHVPPTDEDFERAADYVLGLNELQMNKERDYGNVRDNQLRTLEYLGVFRVEPEGKSKAATDLKGTEA